MRVAYVCTDHAVPVWGQRGSSVHVEEMIRGLIRCGATVDLFAAHLDGIAPRDLSSVYVHQLPDLGKGDLARREQAALGLNDFVRALLKKHGPFDLVYERYALWSYAAMEYAEATNTPRVLEVNAPLIEEQTVHHSLVDRESAEMVTARAFLASTVLLAVSDAIANYLNGFWTAGTRVHVVPNGVDPSRFPPNLRASLPAPKGTWTVGFVGSLAPCQGVSVLLDAFTLLYRRTPRVRLLLVGDGPMREQLAREVRQRGLIETVHFTGAVPPDAVPGLLRSMDAAVAPYPHRSNFYFSPLKVYEYMAAGLPVVASAAGQLLDLIHHGESGLLCPPGETASLAHMLERLQSDPALCNRLGEAARAQVLANHTWQTAAQRVLDLAGVGTPRGTVSTPLPNRAIA
jgi:glycosyltransferase involved in cell wall biosynthesis